MALFLTCGSMPSLGVAAAPLRLFSVSPSALDGGVASTLRLRGEFRRGDIVLADGRPVATRFVGPSLLAAAVRPARRGRLRLHVLRGAMPPSVAPPTAADTPSTPPRRSLARTPAPEEALPQPWVSRPLDVRVKNRAPALSVASRFEVDERERLVVQLRARDPDGDPLRFGATKLPPGAHFDPAEGRITFTPDFIQGGQTFRPRVWVHDGEAQTAQTIEIVVRDTIAPPAPAVVSTRDRAGIRHLRLAQKTDTFLDAPREAGRLFRANISVPLAAAAPHSLPVSIHLHGFSAPHPLTVGADDEIRIAPHDPDNTYWWGYAARRRGRPVREGPVRPYTLRRVLHLLEWVLRTQPAADPERVYVRGSSMGGAGAAVLGLLHARHFAWADARYVETIPRYHRRGRIRQLSGFYGEPGLGLPDGEPGGDGLSVWDRMDLTRVLLSNAEARNQFTTTHLAKDDHIIHFSAAVQPSPLTGVSFYEVLQREGLGHYAIWDEGAHGQKDPVLGPAWWDSGWHPIHDRHAFLRRDRAFVAFSHASSDRDPGEGSRAGGALATQPHGHAGRAEVRGDTGWDGELAGVLNRFLRWDASRLVDTDLRFEVPLRVIDGEGRPAPRPGYPSLGDRFDRELPVRVTVTPRRVQAFHLRPGERVNFALGEQRGTASAAEDGSLSVAGLALDHTWRTLILTRARPAPTRSPVGSPGPDGPLAVATGAP